MNSIETKIGKPDIWPNFIKDAFKCSPFNTREQMIVTTFAYLNKATLQELKEALLDRGALPKQLNYVEDLWKQMEQGTYGIAGTGHLYSFDVESGKWLYIISKQERTDFSKVFLKYCFSNIFFTT
jgi:hypothetical protein